MKLNEIITIYNNLKNIVDNKELDINSILKFRMLGTLKQLSEYVDNFNIVRREKFLQYGKENEEGIFFIPKEDKDSINAFNEDIANLLSSEIDIEIIKYKASDLIELGVDSDVLLGLYYIMEE